MMSRKEQYKHPLWQRKRLIIFERDGWCCLACGLGGDDLNPVQLNAHHLYYIKGMHIWEYDDEAIVTLCNDCHGALHADLVKIAGILAFKILTCGIDAVELDLILDMHLKKNKK
jgi:5-methylcytosine-specific restriction endonuclease McrA